MKITVKIKGPQGSGKTTLKEFFVRKLYEAGIGSWKDKDENSFYLTISPETIKTLRNK